MSSDRLILCYHAVSHSWPSDLAVEPAVLRRQVETLLDGGYQPLTFSEAAAGEVGGRVLAVTFDDAFDSVFELALPILAELGVPATLYVPTDFPDSGVPFRLPGDAWLGTEHESELSCMSWDRVRELRDRGWEIGSHTCSHPWLTQITDEQLRHELDRSRAVCADRLGAPPTSLAYPYGDHDDRVVAATAAAGYSFACTVPHRFEDFTSSPLRQARIDVTRTESERAFRLRTSLRLRRIRASRAIGAADWIDRHRLHRATVTGATRSALDTLRTARRVRALCRNWRQVLGAMARGRPCARFLLRDGTDLWLGRRPEKALDDFVAAFVDDPLASRLAHSPRRLAVDVGAGDDLLWARLATMGFERVVCSDPEAATVAEIVANRDRNGIASVSAEQLEPRSGPDLRQLLDRHAADSVDFLRLAVGGREGALLRDSTSRDLEGIGSLLIPFRAESSPQRLDEVLARLRELGFHADLEPGPGNREVHIWATRR